MATVEEAREYLRGQKRIVLKEIEGFHKAIDSGVFLQPKRTLQRWIAEDKAKIEAMDYVLSFLESEEEESCPEGLE